MRSEPSRRRFMCPDQRVMTSRRSAAMSLNTARDIGPLLGGNRPVLIAAGAPGLNLGPFAQQLDQLIARIGDNAILVAIRALGINGRGLLIHVTYVDCLIAAYSSLPTRPKEVGARRG